MAITSIGTLGQNASKTANQTTTVLTLTAAAEAGNLVILLVAVDNRTTGGGDQNAVTGVTDSAGGNTWTKCVSVAGTGAAQAHANIDIWRSVLTNQINNGGTITATFQTSTTSDASAITAWEFDIGAGASAALEGTPATQEGNSDVPTLNVTTANIECLRIRGAAIEHPDGMGAVIPPPVPTTGWTHFIASPVGGVGTSGGGSASNMSVQGEWRISTGTGDVSDNNWFPNSSSDYVTAYVAIKETGGATPKTITIQKPSSVAMLRSVGKDVLISQPKAPVVRRTILDRILISQPKTAGAFKTVFAARARPSISQGKALTVNRLKAKVQLLNLQQSKAATLLRAAGKDVFISQAKDVTLRRSILDRIAIAQAKTATLLRSVARRLVVTQAKAVATARAFIPGGGDTFPQIINITQAKAATLLRAVFSILEVAQAKAVTLRRSIADRITVTQAKAVTLRRAVAVRVLVAQAKALAITALKAFTRQIAITQAKAVAITRRLAAVRLINVTQAKAVTLRRAVAAVLRVLQSKVVTAGTGGQIFTRTVNVAQAKALVLRKNYSKVFAIILAKAVVVRRIMRTRLLISQAKTPQLIRAVARRILVAQGKAVATIRIRAKPALILISQSKVLTLFRAFLAGIPVRTTTSARGQPEAPTRRQGAYTRPPDSIWRRK